MSSDDIRETFLRFFTARQHLRIAAASVVPAGDPTLLYVNAGMAPLKPYFTGEAIPPAPDLCNVQPCVRTIDIEDVGDRHHLTFFEMLGSWSVDHYGRDRAVELAWDLLTGGFGFAPGQLYVTVYAGDSRLGVPPDEVSAAAWERTGVPRDHIVWLGEDNFWTAGDTGPCGPCTEVFFDTGPGNGPAYPPGGEFDTAGRYIEIWNAGVFIEYQQRAPGELEPLRFASVDTGSGLERMAMVLQGCDSVYETDLFAPVTAAARAVLGPGAADRDVRVVADHVRSAAFILGEGVTPSNEGRGYIPRRLLRTAIAHTVRASGDGGSDLREVASAAIGVLGPHYPALAAHRDTVLALLGTEQRDFGAVVRRGLDQLAALGTGPGGRVSAQDAFTLHATHGLPIDLIRNFAAGRGGSVDEAGFARLQAEHRERSRATGGSRGDDASGPGPGGPGPEALRAVAASGPPPTDFLGYGQTSATGRLLALAGLDGQPVTVLAAGERGLAVTDRTPFYAEGGGQVGDTGVLTTPGGTSGVLDTQSVAGRHVHLVEVTRGELRPGDTAELTVDAARRRAVMRNHSATHLLHAALRQVLGPATRQAGSLVAPDRLRFDFTAPRPPTRAELDQAERLVNAEVLANADRRTDVRAYTDAVGGGAIAFFGDSYGDQVRVVSFGGFSAELCGGTHVTRTAEIGLFRIVSEGSIGAGVRRIEALTGDAAVGWTLDRDRLLADAAARLRVPPEQLPDRVSALAARGPRRRAAPSGPLAGPGDVAVSGSGTRYVVATSPDGDLPGLPAATRRLSGELDALAIVLLPGAGDGGLRVGVAVPPGLATALDARRELDRVLAVTGGRGGGSAVFAQGGGLKLTDPGEAASVITDAYSKI
ncbi:MAG TPA: alanine--tRNA ligase [Streptosporangiaceae bacterium]|nr:alanine--tRNA ligase [Streptosporangiaceae bacterium]